MNIPLDHDLVVLVASFPCGFAFGNQGQSPVGSPTAPARAYGTDKAK